jgi:spore maturation protein CgeB
VRLLYGHGYTSAPHFGLEWIDSWLSRLRAAGISVHSLQLGLNVPGRRLSFSELDRRWRRGDRALMALYESVATATESAEVLINAGAMNLHPEFLEQLAVRTVLNFNDDPESSAASRPVAAHHDLCMIGNVAEVELYKSWGVRRVEWWPIGFRADDYDPSLTGADIVNEGRAVDVALLCERLTSYRRAKVDRFALAFPQGEYYGPGWPKGFLPEALRIPLLRRTRIGINIHNSTGPINFRTYYLPANGVMQICDNRGHLARIYELGSEVIGYETIDEAIELCRFYLDHEDERRAIALAGWRRALRDYNEVAVFKRLLTAVESINRPLDEKHKIDLNPVLARHVQATRNQRFVHSLVAPIVRPIEFAVRVVRGTGRRVSRWVGNSMYRLRAGR